MIVVDTKSIPLIPTDDAPTMSIKRLYELPPAHMHYQPLIQRLPNEILGKIFLDATTLSERHAGIRLATTLTHVCSRWRQLALWTSSLWGNITITFPTSREQMARTVAFLLRSRSHPLDLLLDFRDPEWDWEEDTHPFSWKDMEAVLRLLFTHVKRWRHFELLTDTWAPIFTFLWYSRRITTVPMLQTISLSRCNAYFASKGQRFQPASLKQPIPLFGGVALDGLREVTLSGVHLDWAQSPLQNLTSLELKYHASDVMPTLAQFTDILAACPDLQRLSIIGWGPRLPEGAHGTPISDMLGSGKPHVGKILHMPHLTDFSFGFIDIDYAMELLSLFTFPALRTLSLEDLAASLTPLGMQDATPLLEWLTSHCPAQCPAAGHTPTCCAIAPIPLARVDSLELHGISTNETSFLCFLHQFTALQHLSFYHIRSNLIEALAPIRPTPPSRPFPCPMLTQLTCHGVDASQLADVLMARAGNDLVLPIEHVYLDSLDPDAFE